MSAMGADDGGFCKRLVKRLDLAHAHAVPLAGGAIVRRRSVELQ